LKRTKATPRSKKGFATGQVWVESDGGKKNLPAGRQGQPVYRGVAGGKLGIV